LFKRFFLLFFLFGAAVAFSQNSLSLEAEIRSIEQKTNQEDPYQKHDAYARLANLKQLSGDYEGAARNWLEAAAAVPGSVDDDALFSCALCLALTGEWESASKALEPLLFKSADARFLEACVLAWREGDTSALLSIANAGDYEQKKAQIYFILWKTEKNDVWKQRLVAEFPKSPEAIIAVDSGFSVKTNPLWLFISSREVFSQMENAAQATPRNTQQSDAQTVKPVQLPDASIIQPAQPPDAVRLQTGVFSKQANADDLIARLKKAGFIPYIEKRLVNGNEMMAVIVPAGKDVNASIKELRDAGFDSFPVK